MSAQKKYDRKSQTEKPATPKQSEPETKDNLLKPLTPDEQAIAARVSEGDREWETISEESINDFSLMAEAYPIPPEAKERQDKKEFAFRFIEMTAKRLDEVRNLPVPLKWWVCNSTNTPFLQKHCDPVHGAVQVRDQILVFKPYWMHRKHQAAKMDLADSKDAAGSIQSKTGFEQEGKVEWSPNVTVKSNEVVEEIENTDEAFQEA